MNVIRCDSMNEELLVIGNDQKLSDDLYSALSSDYSLRKYDVGLPTLNQVKSISPLLILIEANLFDAIIEQNLTGYMIGYKTLIYGGDWSDSKQIIAYTHGISGYCGENVKAIVIQEAVRNIIKGDIWIKHQLISTVINDLFLQQQEDTGKNDFENDLFELLSNRELEVVRRVQIGESNKEIADKLCISERTVKAHLSSTFKKLDVPDRLNLVVLLQKYSMS